MYDDEYQHVNMWLHREYYIKVNMYPVLFILTLWLFIMLGNDNGYVNKLNRFSYDSYEGVL